MHINPHDLEAITRIEQALRDGGRIQLAEQLALVGSEVAALLRTEDREQQSEVIGVHTARALLLTEAGRKILKANTPEPDSDHSGTEVWTFPGHWEIVHTRKFEGEYSARKDGRYYAQFSTWQEAWHYIQIALSWS